MSLDRKVFSLLKRSLTLDMTLFAAYENLLMSNH